MFPFSSVYQHFPLENTSENDDHDQNPNSSNGHDHLPYSNIPTIFEDDGLLLSHLLSQQQLILSGNTNSHTDEISFVASNRAAHDHNHHGDLHRNPVAENPTKLGFSKKQRAKAQTAIPRRTRTGKKDRHSKISTAQGLRDRRMRLSLQIARKFFDLQDMLGFDKASKTIEWLITKSKTAIKELKDSLAKQSCSSASEGEVVSKSAEKEDDDEDRDLSLVCMRREKRIRKVHKPIARESRDKARARARERTREKILEKSRHTSTAEANNETNVDLGNSRANISTSFDHTQQETDSSPLKMVASSSFEQEELKDQFLDHYSISKHVGGVSCGANSEDDFLRFPPCAIFSTTLSSSDTEEHKPGSFFPVTTTSYGQRHNPSSVFGTASSDTHVEENSACSLFAVTTTTGHNYAAGERNPRPVFSTTPNIVHLEQNPSSNFLIGIGTANIFSSLNF